jgi:hypothetical protein
MVGGLVAFVARARHGMPVVLCALCVVVSGCEAEPNPTCTAAAMRCRVSATTLCCNPESEPATAACCPGPVHFIVMYATHIPTGKCVTVCNDCLPQQDYVWRDYLDRCDNGGSTHDAAPMPSVSTSIKTW